MNTKADNTLAFGPGLLKENAIGYPTTFYIQARNVNNQNRESGADEFVVQIVRPDILQRLTEERERIAAVKAKEEEDRKKNPPKKDQQEEEEPKPEGEEGEEQAPAKSLEQELEEKAYVPCKIEDKDDGSYVVTYQLEEPCEVRITINLKNERGELQPIRSSPKDASFSETAQPKANQFTG